MRSHSLLGYRAPQLQPTLVSTSVHGAVHGVLYAGACHCAWRV